MSARDELLIELRELAKKPKTWPDYADALIAAGYRKPRTITTAEELKTVYEGAVLVDPKGDVWSIDGATGRLFSISDGNGDTYDDDDLTLPATVVYEG